MGGGNGGGTKDDDAKHMFDRIGENVYKEVKKDAEKRSKGELAGQLSQASIWNESASSPNPCSPDYTTRFGANSERYPCRKDGTGKDVDRFSVKQQAEYDNKKMKCSYGSNDKNEGACAPFRRLHLCNKNFPNMNSNDSSKAKHDLLAEVCMAANYEAESLITYHDQHEMTNVGSQLCTVLARSFADIGDIVRGKDLFIGNNKRDKLEKQLQKYFNNIYENLEGAAKACYNGDKDNNFFKLREDWWEANRETVWKAITCGAHGTYFHATCSDLNESPSMARDKCRCTKTSGGKPGKSETDQVPTYFDYVPQFLRWFEEWAEDFCRKKKKKLENLQKQCRGKYGDDGTERYCSRNGFDCEQTVNARGKVRMGKGCTDCFFACNPYVEWIDNQRKQFLKQKNKYADEIKIYTEGAPVSRRQKRGAHGGSNDNGYEKKFYDELNKREYGTLEGFLGLLSNEKACTNINDTEGGKINFKEEHDDNNNDKKKGTFYRSEYCQPCPLCGVKKTNDGSGGNTKWKRKEDMDECPHINLYKPINDKNGTPINFLYSGDRHVDIAKNLKAFCTKTQNGGGGSGDCGGNSDPSLCEPWKCYHVKQLVKEIKENGVNDDEYDKDVKEGGGLCILKKEKKGVEEAKSQNDPDEIQKTFHDFFFYWVAHMLKDSIHWRTKKIKGCLEKKNGNRCNKKNNCKDDCQCFQRWIDKKKTEWKAIKEHFRNQEAFKKEGGNSASGMLGKEFESPDFVLEGNLKLQFLKKVSTEDSEEDSQSRDEDAEEMKHLKKILKLEDENTLVVVNAGTEQNTTIDKLLDYELTDAKECIKKCDKKPQKPEGGAGEDRGRSAGPSPPPRPAGDTVHEVAEVQEEEDEDDEDGDDTTVEEAEDAKVDGGSPKEAEAPKQDTKQGSGPPATDTSVDVCSIVDKLFKDDNTLKNACPTKYVNGREKFPNWKCIPSGVTTTRSSGATTGGLCIPPRRRRLYVGKLTEWAKKQVGNTGESQPQTGGGSESTSEGKTTSKSSGKDPREALRDAFIESAAVETDAFIESAAVETFFLWHKFIKEKEREKKEKDEIDEIVASETSDEAQKELEESGNIPEDFKRQMFYTLGDYRDICVGVKDDVAQALKASGDTKIKDISEKIQKILKGDNNQESGSSPSHAPGKKNPVQTPKEWWDKNASHIWNGMICALTYNTDSNGKDKKIEQVKATDNTDLFEKLKDKYGEYDKVELKEENDTEVKGQDDSQHGQTTSTHLSKFVLRPPYFRYLEEWGENFCKERTKRLEQIKEDCKQGHGRCSGYGENCDDQLGEDPSTVRDFLCSTCARHCSFYKKWIERKGKEFSEQKNVYADQKDKYRTESNGAEINNNDNGFSKTLERCNSAAEFLKRLKNGPCKNENENGKDKLDFSQPEKTFKHTEYCDPCSEFKIDCKKVNCSKDKRSDCNGGKITPQNIKDKTDPNGNIEILVSDDSANGFKDGLHEA
ncbi:hypothetical protein PFTANZ_06171, partial [Plasmodium falciparum Tanzania (2000708)]